MKSTDRKLVTRWARELARLGWRVVDKQHGAHVFVLSPCGEHRIALDVAGGGRYTRRHLLKAGVEIDGDRVVGYARPRPGPQT